MSYRGICDGHWDAHSSGAVLLSGRDLSNHSISTLKGFDAPAELRVL
jgi:hypothetical protein